LFEHFDLVIECDVQTPAQILCRDVVLVPVCTQTPPARRPRSTTSTLFLSFAA
jgi:hypothetical protein